MKNAFLILLMLIFTGCPEPSEPYDTNIYLINKSNHSVAVPFFPFTSNKNLTLSELGIINPLDRVKRNNQIIDPGDSLIVDRGIKEGILDVLSSEGGVLYYAIDIDSLEQLPWSEVRDNHRGVTTYFFKTYEELEAVDFRLVYPKEE